MQAANSAPNGTAQQRQCRECGSDFAGERWQKLCWTCWREQRDADEREVRWQNGYDHGFLDGFRAGCSDRPQIDATLVNRALCLTHPDRHPAERAQEATAVTALLLELRQPKRHAA